MSYNVVNFNENDSRISAFLEPGTHTVRLLSMWAEESSFNKDFINLKLLVEGPAMEDPNFKGWNINPDHPEMGTFAGQIATVANGKYSFSDFTSKIDGKVVTRDEQIFNWVCKFAKNIGKWDTFVKTMSEDFPTIQSFLKAAIPTLCDGSNWFNLTIAGSEYTNNKGYTAYRLFIPKAENGKNPVCPGSFDEVMLNKRFMMFNPDKHIIKQTERKEVPVDSFAGRDESASNGLNTKDAGLYATTSPSLPGMEGSAFRPGTGGYSGMKIETSF